MNELFKELSRFFAFSIFVGILFAVIIEGTSGLMTYVLLFISVIIFLFIKLIVSRIKLHSPVQHKGYRDGRFM